MSIKTILLTLAFSLPLALFAQQKKQLTENDYAQWHTLSSGPVSPDGKWTSYTMIHKDGNDTLFLKNIETKTLFHYPKGHLGKISDDGKWFLCIVQDTLKIVGLKKSLGYNIANVTDYKLQGNTLISRIKDSISTTLLIQKIGTSTSKTVKNVNEFSMNALGTSIVLIREENGINIIEVIDTSNYFKTKTIKSDNEHGYKGITWNEKGDAFAFYGGINPQGNNEQIELYRCKYLKSEYQTSNMTVPERLKGYSINNLDLSLSDDGNKVFFDLTSSGKPNTNPVGVTVFKHSDNIIPPSSPKEMFWHVWLVEKDHIMALEDTIHPIALPVGNYKYALVYSHGKYLPLHEYNGYYIDLYLMNTATGKKTLLVEKQLYEYQQVLVSPTGKYIAYFKDREWWLYDIEKELHKKVEGGVGNPFYDAENDYPHEAPYGIAGWTKEDREVLVMDKHDVWLLNCKSGQISRITNGREKNSTYRVYSDGLYPKIHEGFGFTTKEHNLEDGVIIVGYDNTTADYKLCIYSSSKGLRTITEGNGTINAVKKAVDSNDYYFLENSFSTPPQLIHVGPTGRQSIVVRSNEQQNKYHWGTSQLISFDTSDKKGLNAALFFPADYDPKKSYPMVVIIYQDKSKEVHNYIHPSLETYDGYNITNLTSKGYFVLMPDIHFIMNAPGKSALKCVLAASEAALKTANINKEKIALTGHSFGGFETAYIVGQTDFFKTAIIGSAVTDLLSLYLDIDPFNKSNMERFDNGQFRNRQPFYSNEFITESPLHNVTTINTPMLIWAGREDRLAPTENSIKLHSALWKLGKESNLLLYSGEQHVIEDPLRQADLQHKITDWLEYYLKDGVKPKWLQ